jgi:hypothetical protein
MRKLLITIIALFVLASCDEGKKTGTDDAKPAESGGAAPSEQLSSGADARYALEITPKNPVRSSFVSLVPSGFDLSQATFEWLANNGIVAGANDFQLNLSELKKGDVVRARAFFTDQVVLSDEITILNSPPEVAKVEVVPDAIADGGSLRADVLGKDIDEDTVSFAYAWKKNGDPAGEGARIDGTLKRGDFVTVTITPFDGAAYGSSVIVRREIANMPPVITAHKEFGFDGSVYTYQVRASDPDGDTLAYSLEASLNGMTIDPATGLLTWVVPSEFKGKQNIGLSVSDGHGGSAKYSIEASIQ